MISISEWLLLVAGILCILLLMGLLGGIFRYLPRRKFPLTLEDEKSLLGKCADALLLVSPRGRLIECNPAARALLGDEIDRLRRTGVGQSEGWKHALEVSAPESSEVALGVEDNLRWIETRVYPLKTRQGAMMGKVVLVHEINARKKGQEELEQQFRQAAEKNLQLEMQNSEIRLFTQFGEVLQRCADKQDVYKVSAHYIERLFPGLAGGIYLMNPVIAMAEVVCRWGENPPNELGMLEEDCWAMRLGRPHLVRNPQGESYCRHTQLAGKAFQENTLCIPLIDQGRVLGVLHLRGNMPARHTDWVQMASSAADHVALALSNLDLREHLRLQSVRDPLTDLYNRRFMEEFFESELKRSRRGGYPVGLIMFDIDRFKEFNDTNGHTAADYLLKELGQYLRNSLRGEDVVCRYGGDEFIIILPGASLEDTLRRSEQIRREVNQLRMVQYGKEMPGVTISMGVACSPEHGSTRDEMMRSVDLALYQAKKNGRNCVAVAQSECWAMV